jgi:transcriptional regulator of acetoin/glycerol metabolism
VGRQAKFTKQQLIEALQTAEGDLTRAAVELQVSPSTVYRAMGRHGVVVRETRKVVAV